MPPIRGNIASFLRPFVATPPTVRAVGAVTAAAAAVTPAYPTGTAVGDLAIMFVETAGTQAITCSGWYTLCTAETGDATTGTRLTVLWRIVANVSTDNRTTSDSGDHQIARIIGIQAGTFHPFQPFHDYVTGVDASATTSITLPAITTSDDNCLILTGCSGSLPDSNSTAQFSSWSNSNLSSLTERIDNSQNAGHGGALGVASGVKATAGSTGTTTVTGATSAVRGKVTIAISPYNPSTDFLFDALYFSDSTYFRENCSMAYSLRRLTRGYGGPCIRVKRSSDGTEQDIYWNAQGWVDSDAIETFVGTGDGYVVTWYDQIDKNTRSLSSPADNYRPKIATSGAVLTKNGRPAMAFIHNLNGASSAPVLYKLPRATTWLGTSLDSTVDASFGAVVALDSGVGTTIYFASNGATATGGNLRVDSSEVMTFNDESSSYSNPYGNNALSSDGTLCAFNTFAERNGVGSNARYGYTSENAPTVVTSSGTSIDSASYVTSANLFVGAWNYPQSSNTTFHMCELFWFNVATDQRTTIANNHKLNFID